MKTGRLLLVASMAALLGACNDTGTGSGSSNTRRNDGVKAGGPAARSPTPIARPGRSDAGVPGSGATNNVGGSATGETTSGVSSGDNAAKAPATGTTAGGNGNTGTNGTAPDQSSGSTNSASGH